MRRQFYILGFTCFLMFLSSCGAEQMKSARQEPPTSEDFKEEAEEMEPRSSELMKERSNQNAELLSSKHYWKLGEQKVEDLVDLVRMLSDSTIDTEMRNLAQSEALNLVILPDTNAQFVFLALQDVKKIRATRERTDLVDCDSGVSCFSMEFAIKKMDRTKRVVKIYFVLAEEIHHFGSESEIIKKVKIKDIDVLEIDLNPY